MLEKTPKAKKVLFVLIVIVAGLFLLTMIGNLVLGRIAETKIRAMLQSPESGYTIDFKRAKINLFTMTVILKEVHIAPDSLLMAQYKNHVSDQKTLYQVNLPKLRLRHLNATSAIGTKVVEIEEVLFDDAVFTVYTGGGKRVKKSLTAKQVEKGININKIPIPGIGGVDIGFIRFNNFSINMVDPLLGDTLLNNDGSDFTLDNLRLIKNPLDTNTFKLVLKDIRLQIQEEAFDFSTKNYHLSFSNLLFSAKNRQLHLENLKVTPVRDMYVMAASFKYRNDVFKVVANKVDISLGVFNEMLVAGAFYLPKVNIQGLNLFVMRNRSLAFDETKRPKLPNELLKSMKTGLTIDSLFINNSTLTYQESNKDNNPPMKVALDDLNIQVYHITSIHDSMSNDRPMKMNLQAKLQSKIPLEAHFIFPLLSKCDTFNYYGTLGGGSMTVFNPMVESAVGLKFPSGQLKGITFKVEANNTYAIGKMTMLYNGLEGIVLRKDGASDNKFLSWLANQVVKSDNPFVGVPPRQVPIFFNRVMYKGFGNFAFKALLNGVLATTIPTFEKSNQNKKDVVKQTSKKDMRKRKRAERKSK